MTGFKLSSFWKSEASADNANGEVKAKKNKSMFGFTKSKEGESGKKKKNNVTFDEKKNSVTVIETSTIKKVDPNGVAFMSNPLKKSPMKSLDTSQPTSSTKNATESTLISTPERSSMLRNSKLPDGRANPLSLHGKKSVGEPSSVSTKMRISNDENHTTTVFKSLEPLKPTQEETPETPQPIVVASPTRLELFPFPFRKKVSQPNTPQSQPQSQIASVVDQNSNHITNLNNLSFHDLSAEYDAANLENSDEERKSNDPEDDVSENGNIVFSGGRFFAVSTDSDEPTPAIVSKEEITKNSNEEIKGVELSSSTYLTSYNVAVEKNDSSSGKSLEAMKCTTESTVESTVNVEFKGQAPIGENLNNNVHNLLCKDITVLPESKVSEEDCPHSSAILQEASITVPVRFDDCDHATTIPVILPSTSSTSTVSPTLSKEEVSLCVFETATTVDETATTSTDILKQSQTIDVIGTTAALSETRGENIERELSQFVLGNDVVQPSSVKDILPVQTQLSPVNAFSPVLSPAAKKDAKESSIQGFSLVPQERASPVTVLSPAAKKVVKEPDQVFSPVPQEKPSPVIVLSPAVKKDFKEPVQDKAKAISMPLAPQNSLVIENSIPAATCSDSSAGGADEDSEEGNDDDGFMLDLANIYEEPQPTFISNCLNGAQTSQRETSIESALKNSPAPNQPTRSMIPYITMRGKTQSLAVKTRPIRTSKDSSSDSATGAKSADKVDCRTANADNQTEIPLKSFDSSDVHVDLAVIYEEPPTIFLSNCMTSAHGSTRVSVLERSDSLPSPNGSSSPVASNSPKVLSLPYLSARGLIKALDSGDDVSQDASAGSSGEIRTKNSFNSSTGTSGVEKFKSLDVFFDNPFESNSHGVQSSASKEHEESRLDDFFHCAEDIEVLDAAPEYDAVVPPDVVDDHCQYEYKDIMNLESLDNIDFFENPLRNEYDGVVNIGVNATSSTSAIDPNHHRSSSPWNWRTIVAGTASPALHMISPSLVKPHRRRQSSNGSVFAFPRGSQSDDTDVGKEEEEDPIAKIEGVPEVTSAESTVESLPTNCNHISPVKAHRRSSEMVDLDSCLTTLLHQQASGVAPGESSEIDRDNYSVPSICKISRDIRKLQLKHLSIHDSGSEFEAPSTTLSGSPTKDFGQISKDFGQISLHRMRIRAAEVTDCRNKAASSSLDARLNGLKPLKVEYHETTALDGGEHTDKVTKIHHGGTIVKPSALQNVVEHNEKGVTATTLQSTKGNHGGTVVKPTSPRNAPIDNLKPKGGVKFPTPSKSIAPIQIPKGTIKAAKSFFGGKPSVSSNAPAQEMASSTQPIPIMNAVPVVTAVATADNSSVGLSKMKSRSGEIANEAIEKAMRSSSSTAMNINRLCNALKPAQLVKTQKSQVPLPNPPAPKTSKVSQVKTVPNAASIGAASPIHTNSAPAVANLKETLSSPSVNVRLDLIMGRGEKDVAPVPSLVLPTKRGYKKPEVLSIPSSDFEAVDKAKVTLMESLVSFDRNIVKEAQKRKLTLAAKLDLKILKAAVESVNRLDHLTMKSKNETTPLTAEEKKELKTLTQQQILLDRVHNFANSDRSNRKYSAVEKAELQPLKQELERQVKFTRLYRKHKNNDPFSFDEKAEYILLKESLEAEKRFGHLLKKFNSTEGKRSDKLKNEITVMERVELIIMKLEQDKHLRYDILLAKEKACSTVMNSNASNPRLTLAEKSELAIIRKEIELQWKQHQDKISQLAQQLRQGYTYSANMDPFAVAVSSSRSNDSLMAAMTSKALSISMDSYESSRPRPIVAEEVEIVNGRLPQVDVNDTSYCAEYQHAEDDVIPANDMSTFEEDFDPPSSVTKTTITSTENVDATNGNTTVITIIIKDSNRKGINISSSSNDDGCACQIIESRTKENFSSSVDNEHIKRQSIVDSEFLDEEKNVKVEWDSVTTNKTSEEKGKKTNSIKFGKQAEENLKKKFAEKELELAREKQRKLEEFLHKSTSRDCAKVNSENLRPLASSSVASMSCISTETASSLSETYDAYPHFSITQKAELNLLKLEGEKQRRLEEEKQRRLAQFLNVSSASSGVSNSGIVSGMVSSRRSMVESQTQNQQQPKCSNNLRNDKISNNIKSTGDSNSTAAVSNNNSSSAIATRSSRDLQPEASTRSDLLTSVIVKPVPPSSLRRSLSNSEQQNSNVPEISNQNSRVSSTTSNVAKWIPTLLSSKTSSFDNMNNTYPGPSRAQQIQPQQSHQQHNRHASMSSMSSGSGSIMCGSGSPSNRKQPAIVQIFEQAKEIHRKSEIERIECLKNDPSRKIIDPPFSLILGSTSSSNIIVPPS